MCPIWLLSLACFARLDLNPPADTGDTGPADSAAADSGHDSATDSADSGTTEPVPIEVISVDPDQGPSGGGPAITVAGGPFQSGARVWFGANEATVVSVTSDSIVVTLPSGEPGVADVHVESADADVTSPEAFRYHTDALGQAVLLIAVEATDEVVFNWDQYIDQVAIDARFIDPADVDHAHLIAASIESCDPGIALPGAVSGGSPLVLKSAQRTYSVESTTGAYALVSADSGVLAVAGDRFDLGISADATRPAIDLSAALTVPSALEITSPELDAWLLPTYYGQSVQLEWQSGAGDFAVVRVEDPDTGQVERCLVDNDGAFEIPREVFQRFTLDWTGETLRVAVHVHSLTESTLAFNNGEVRSTGSYGQAGAIYMLPWW